MKTILLVLACFGAASVLGLKGGFRVRFGIGSYGTKYFVDMPKSRSDAVSQGWTPEDRVDTDVLPNLSMLCHSSKYLCILFDDTDYPAGLQVAVPADEFKDSIYDWNVQGFIQWQPSDGKNYWATQQYYVDEAFLSSSAENRINNRDADKFLQANGVWVRGINREILRIGSTSDDITKAGFTKQGCIPLMGRHHFRNMTVDMPCDAEHLYPFFTLTNKDELIATGLLMFGKLEEKEVDFFERPPKPAVQAIIPRGSQCVYDLTENPGVVSIHMYYIDRPWTVTCLPIIS